MLDPKVRVETMVSVALAERIQNCMKIFHYRSVNKVAKQLIEVGLNAIENADTVNTPEKVQQLMKEFEEGSLVDYIAKLDQKGFDVLWSIMTTENQVRYGNQNHGGLRTGSGRRKIDWNNVLGNNQDEGGQY